MIQALLLIVGGLLGAAVALAVAGRLRARRGPGDAVAVRARRILFPFVGQALSQSGLDAAVRLARAEEATLVPAYLASISMGLHLDAPLPRTCEVAFGMFEAIEQDATAHGVPVDTRIARGRNPRHAMRQLLADERYDRIVVAAGPDGFSADDVAWLLSNAPGEILVLRPPSRTPAASAAPRPRRAAARPEQVPERPRAAAAAPGG